MCSIEGCDRIIVGGEPLAIHEIMARYRRDGSCSLVIREALLLLAHRDAAIAALNKPERDQGLGHIMHDPARDGK